MRSQSANRSYSPQCVSSSLCSRRSARSTANAFQSSLRDCRNAAHPMPQTGSRRSLWTSSRFTAHYPKPTLRWMISKVEMRSGVALGSPSRGRDNLPGTVANRAVRMEVGSRAEDNMGSSTERLRQHQQRRLLRHLRRQHPSHSKDRCHRKRSYLTRDFQLLRCQQAHARQRCPVGR